MPASAGSKWGRATLMRWMVLAWIALAFLTVWLCQVPAPEPDTWRFLAGDAPLCFFEGHLRTFADEPWLILRRGLRWAFIHNVDGSFRTLPLISVLFAGLTLVLIRSGLKGAGDGLGAALAVVFAALCVFHPSYGASWMLGDRFHLFSVGLGAILALYLMTRWRNVWGWSSGFFVALLLSLTTSFALAVWAAGLLALVPASRTIPSPQVGDSSSDASPQKSDSTRRWRPFLLWLFLSQVVCATVFVGSRGFESRAPNLSELFGLEVGRRLEDSSTEWWQHHLQWLGLGLPLPKPEAAWRMYVGLALVGLGLLQISRFGWRVWRNKAINQHQIWAAGCTLAGFVLLWLAGLRGYPVLSAETAFWEAAPGAWILGFGVCVIPCAARESLWRQVLLAALIIGVLAGAIDAIPDWRLRHRVLKAAIAEKRYAPLVGRRLSDPHPRLFAIRALPELTSSGVGLHLNPTREHMDAFMVRTDGVGGTLTWPESRRIHFELSRASNAVIDLAFVIRWRGESAEVVAVLRPMPLDEWKWSGPFPAEAAFHEGDSLRVIGVDENDTPIPLSRRWQRAGGVFVEQGG